MGHLFAEKERQITLAPGLLTIIDAAEAAGWSVKRGDSSVELVKPASPAEAGTAGAAGAAGPTRPTGAAQDAGGARGRARERILHRECGEKM